MEVTLVNQSIYSLPSKQRVGCIVYDGPVDMQLRPGPGLDRDLSEHYGPGLQRALDSELRKVDGRQLEIGQIIRIHPGRLHCNFLAWLGTREPDDDLIQSAAPSAAKIRDGVLQALSFAAERSVEKVGFSALGAGPGEIPRDERLAIVVRAAQEYHDQCAERGVAPGVEEVFVCEAAGPIFRRARERVGGLAKAQSRPAPKPKAAPKRRSSTRKPASKPRTALGPTATEIAQAQSGAGPYNMRHTYAIGDLFVHPKFGVGKVVSLPAPSRMICAFQDGSERKLLHDHG